MSDTHSVRLSAQVRIVGTGLLGASIGLALRSQGVDVVLADSSPSSVRLAADLGAGRPAEKADAPQVIVVCVPPDVTADVIEAELTAYPDAVVTDVASDLVNRAVERELRTLPVHLVAIVERGDVVAADDLTGRGESAGDVGGRCRRCRLDR